MLYLGETLKVCFLEAVLRDKRNGSIGDYPLDETELRARRFTLVEVHDPLTIVDLRRDSGVRMGVPSDVARASDQRLARLWSVAFHDHPAAPDGIAYEVPAERANERGDLRSRHREAECGGDNAASLRAGLADRARRFL